MNLGRKRNQINEIECNKTIDYGHPWRYRLFNFCSRLEPTGILKEMITLCTGVIILLQFHLNKFENVKIGCYSGWNTWKACCVVVNENLCDISIFSGFSFMAVYT